MKLHPFRVLALILLAAPAHAQYVNTTGAAAPRVTTGTIPGITEAQMYRYTKELNTDFLTTSLAVTQARTALMRASLTIPVDPTALAGLARDLAEAEQKLADARAAAFARIQASSDRLSRDQAALLVAAGGRFVNGANNGAATPIAPMEFNDHDGYVSLFDGVSLKGWDGNPKYWRVENGVMIGESSSSNPSGNSYIAYKGLTAHDMNLKLEIKIEGSAGSGIQYRSKTDLPWLAGISDAVAANNGDVKLNWMQTGPQADFWPTTEHTGQFYSENTPMRILARRGLVVESFGDQRKRILARIGDPAALQGLIKLNDWNEYTIIARGGVFIHAINGQVMAIMIDDDPSSSNNWKDGEIGIELEATGRVLIRNVWLKKLN